MSTLNYNNLRREFTRIDQDLRKRYGKKRYADESNSYTANQKSMKAEKVECAMPNLRRKGLRLV